MSYMTREEYDLVAMSLWRMKLDDVNRCATDYRRHLLAGACLRDAAGEGGNVVELSDFLRDTLNVADFCQKWLRVLTLPKVGPLNLIRSFPKKELKRLFGFLQGRIGRALNLERLYSSALRTSASQALSSRINPAALFDITQSIEWGMRLVAAMGPLLRRGQLNLGTLTALSGSSIVPDQDRHAVAAIIHRATSPEAVQAAIDASREQYLDVWAESLTMADSMMQIRSESELRWKAVRGR